MRLCCGNRGIRYCKRRYAGCESGQGGLGWKVETGRV